MHINDSKAGLGSKADRHENIGKGELVCSIGEWSGERVRVGVSG